MEFMEGDDDDDSIDDDEDDYVAVARCKHPSRIRQRRIGKNQTERREKAAFWKITKSEYLPDITKFVGFTLAKSSPMNA